MSAARFEPVTPTIGLSMHPYRERYSTFYLSDRVAVQFLLKLEIWIYGEQ
jgi:hypothetical protein